jgi:hypothetical protein
MLYSIDHAVGIARDLSDRLSLRLGNQAAAGALNTVIQTQDEWGYPIILVSHGGVATEGNPVVWIRITNLFEESAGAAGAPLDVFGNATLPFTPTVAQIACELTAATFTVSSANATAGAVYSNNGQNFTVESTIASGTTLVASGVGSPLASGTLTKVSGTGDSTITFSAISGLAPIPAASDYATCLFEIARTGTVVQQFSIANATAVTEAAVNAASPVQTLKDIDWGFKGNT